MKNAIILFRRYNDFDHTTPIVNYIAKKNPNLKIYYLCTSTNWDFKKDKNFKYLKNLDNVLVSNFEDFFLNFITRKIFYFTKFKINKFFAKLIIKRKLVQLNPSFVLIDFPNPRKGFLNELISISKRLKIKLIGFRHALWNRVITEVNKEDINNLKNMVKDNLDLDYLIFSNKSNLDYAIKFGGLNKSKGLYLGNPRYSSEWHNKLKENINKDKIKKIDDKVNVVYMDHSAFLGMNGDNIYRSVKKLSQLDFVNFVIKPNTNSMHENSVNLSTNKLLEFDLNFNDSSIDLINWADIVICTQSSIAVEVLLQKKILISASHYHYSNQLWDKYQAACFVKDDDSIIDIIKKFFKIKKNVFYKEENVKEYLDEIQANELGGNTLERFNKFLEKQI